MQCFPKPLGVKIFDKYLLNDQNSSNFSFSPESGLESIRSILIVSCVQPISRGSLLIHPSDSHSSRLRVMQGINISVAHFRIKYWKRMNSWPRLFASVAGLYCTNKLTFFTEFIFQLFCDKNSGFFFLTTLCKHE